MVLIDLRTKSGRSLLILDNLTAIEYEESSGELAFIGAETARPVWLAKGTPAEKVWNMILQALDPAYAGRAMHVHAICIVLDFRKLQEGISFS